MAGQTKNKNKKNFVVVVVLTGRMQYLFPLISPIKKEKKKNQKTKNQNQTKTKQINASVFIYFFFSQRINKKNSQKDTKKKKEQEEDKKDKTKKKSHNFFFVYLARARRVGGLFPAGPRARFLATLLSTVLSFVSILDMLLESPEGLETGAAVGLGGVGGEGG